MQGGAEPMKKIIATLCLLALTGCATAPVKPVEYVNDVSYQRIIDMPGMNKTDIFNKSRQWYALTFKSSKQAIEYQDILAGKIIAKGSDTVYFTMDMPFGGTQKIPQAVGFTIVQEIKDEKTKITFNNIGLISYTGSNYSNIDTGSWQQLEPRLAAFTDNLKAFLSSKETGW